MKLALGTVQFGLAYGVANRQGQIALEEVRAIIAHARDSGIDTLDTAIAYGDSEQRLGSIGVTEWRVVSKLPAIPDDCADIDGFVADNVRGSLERLQIDALHGMLLHQPQQLLGPRGNELYASLQQLKSDGLVHKIGASIYTPEQLDVLFEHYPLDIVQAPFSVLDRRVEQSGWLTQLRRTGVETHVRSVFLQGLLLMKPTDRPAKFTRWASQLARFDDWVAHSGMTALQACLVHVASFTAIDRVVVGIDSLRHLEELIISCSLPAAAAPEQLAATDVELLDPLAWLRL